MTISFPTNTKDIIDEIRGTIGRDIIIYVTVTGIPCTNPLCSLDPVTNLSTNAFCTVCDGNYWLEAVSGFTISGHVRWLSADQPLWTPGGQIDEGDCKVTITFSSGILNNVKAAKYFVVDDTELYMKKFRLKGAQGVNRIQITLLEDPDIG